MRLIFVRHGLTTYNKLGRIHGYTESKLCEEGLMQAKKTALKLKESKIDLIYSSDLSRAKDTAKEIKKYHPRTPIIFAEELRERNWGIYEGQMLEGNALKKWRAERDTPGFRHEGSETLEEVHLRIKSFVEKILHENRDSTVVLISHGYVGRVLVAIIMDNSLEEVANIPPFSNASISVFELTKGKKHPVYMINDTSHLSNKNVR